MGRALADPLGVHPWMTAPQTQAVFAALEAEGGPDCARFVGGCVRNTLLGRPVDDIDVATRLTPDAVVRALEAAGLRAVPTGVEHGTVTAISGGRPYEITTLRRDVATDGRRAVVAFTEDWAEDAQRRDFTLNALYADMAGVIFDGTGTGVADALAGRIVFVGDPARRIAEDHLRILRFFRFQAWYGQGEPDAAGLAACAAARATLTRLAAERVSKELLKLLAADDPRPAVALMAERGVLSVVLPETTSLARFSELVVIEGEQMFECDPLLRLAALLPDAAAARSAGARLRLSNAEQARLAAALAAGPALTADLSPREARRAVYALGAQAFRDQAKLAWAAAGASASAADWRALIALGEAWTPPAAPFDGADVQAAGVPAGPEVGRLLRALQGWWIDNDFAADREAAQAALRVMVQGTRP